MLVAPEGSGFVLVMVGAMLGFTVVKENALLFAPATFVAVIERLLVAAASGVPVSVPDELRLAHDGNPVPVHVIGTVPLAANWKEYAFPTVPPGSGLADVIEGATG